MPPQKKNKIKMYGLKKHPKSQNGSMTLTDTSPVSLPSVCSIHSIKRSVSIIMKNSGVMETVNHAFRSL